MATASLDDIQQGAPAPPNTASLDDIATPLPAPQAPAQIHTASLDDIAPAGSAPPSDGTGWLSQIKDQFANAKTTDIQDEARKALLGLVMGPTGLIPGTQEALQSQIETTPDAGVTTGKGAYQKAASVANLPIAGTFHRKGAGPIEGETEDWVTGQLNPLNVGLAVATMGGSLVEQGLVKAGVPAARAAGLVKLGKIGGDLGFLSKFGYDTYTKAVPELERDWNDYNAEQDHAKKKALLDKLERHGTDIVLGSLAMGLATRGVEHDINEYRASTPKAKAMANVEYGNGIYDYQAGNQIGSGQAAQKYRELMKAIPDEVRRAGITHNIEANGNAATLRDWLAKASPETKPEIEAALNLTDKERAVRDDLTNILNGWKEALRSKNLLAPDGGLDNYMPHRPVFEDTDPVTGELIQKTAADGERDFLKKRLFGSHVEGEANGIKYQTKDAVKLVSDYIERASNALAKNDLAESLANGNMNDAAPMAVSGGYLGHPADVPLSPLEIQQLKASGKFDDLLAKGRIYEVPGTGQVNVGPTQAQPTPTPAPRGATPAQAPAPGLLTPPESSRASTSPEAPPSKRWSGDRGAMPGEPAWFLDGDSVDNAKAAITEIEDPRDPGRHTFEASLPDGKLLGKFGTIGEAARHVESVLPPEPKVSPLPEGAEKFSAANVPEGKNTAEAYAPGTPQHDERAVLQDKIKKEFLDQAAPVPEGEQPRAIILGGGTSSGKSRMIRARDGLDAVRIETDAVRARLPEYREWQKTDPDSASARVHKEAAGISKDIQKQAVDARKNIVVDSTTSGDDDASMIRDLKAKGYRVELHFVNTPTDLAHVWEQDRFENSPHEESRGRRTPPEKIEDTHKNAAKAFFSLKDLADEAHLWDNRVHGQDYEHVSERVENSPEQVYNEDKYNEYRNKANGQETRVGADSPRSRELQDLVQNEVRRLADAKRGESVSPNVSLLEAAPQGQAEGLTRRPNWTQPPGEAGGRRVIPNEVKNYRWKFSDYQDTGLRVNRPYGAQEPVTNALVPHPDTNSFPGEAIVREAHGIPTDPRTGQKMVRVPVFTHPELAPHLGAVLENSAPKNALLRGLLKASSGAKSLLLSLSPFHWNTMISRAFEAGMSPRLVAKSLYRSLAMPTPVDYYNLTPKQQFAIDSGVAAGSTRPGFSDYTSEGLTAGHNSFAGKIPLIGGFNRWVESRLFGPQGFITGLKFDLHDRLTTAIQKDIPNLSREDAGRIAASQVNNKFGGLNYTVMGRSASTQNALRASLLAPDFLESTGRSVLDVAGKHGTPLVKSLVAFNVLHYMVARALNHLSTGQYHPESGLSVYSPDGKREYSVRTTLGDFLHFAEHPRDFMMNRVNPLLVRTPLEVLGGVDAQGNKVTPTQAAWDTVRQVVPIPVQALTPKQQISQPSGMDELLKAGGVGSRKRFSPAETLAYQRATQKSQGAPLEGDALEHAQTKFRLSDALRDSIQAKDAGARLKAMDDIKEARKDGKLSAEEQQQMVVDAYKYPTRLTQTVAHLPLEDSLDVYAAAGEQEKKEIRRAVASKVQSFYSLVEKGKKSNAEYKAIQPRIRQFFQNKP